MSSHLRQTNFTAGELSPFLYGRTDIDLFSRGLRTLKNFIVDRHGMAHSRPGTEYLGQALNSDVPLADGERRGLATAVRLIPFSYSDSISYILEIGAGYIRVWGLGAQPSVVAEILSTTPRPLYEAEDLPLLQWSQVGDKLMITCPGVPAYILERTGPTTFSIEKPDYTLNTPLFFADCSVLPQSGADQPMLVSAGPSFPANIFIGDATHPLREWRWKVTTTFRNTTTGEIVESRTFDVFESYDGVSATTRTAIAAGSKVCLYADKPVTIRMAIPGPFQLFIGHVAIEHNFYRGRGTLFGYVGSSTTNEFVDVGIDPNYRIPPPLGSTPIETSCAANTVFENRRVFAGFASEPGSINLSASNQYENFDRIPKQPSATSSLLYDLNSRKRESIRTLVGLSHLYVFTDSSVWSFAGSGGSPLSADVAPDARVIDEVGSTGLMPIVVNHSILFARNKGRGVRALVPTTTTQAGALAPQDISTHSEHLFVGGESAPRVPDDLIGFDTPTRRIVDWSYAEDPYGIIWVVRDDGVLLSLTYSQGVAAWARHEMDGEVLSVCAVPETNEDVVYLAIRRDIGGGSKTTIERFSSRVRTGNHFFDDRCLDCSITSLLTLPDDPPGGPHPTSLTITGLSHLAGKDVYMTSSTNAPYGPLTVSVGGEITLPEFPAGNFGENNEYLLVTVGLPYTCDLETLDAIPREGRFQVKNVKSVGVEVSGSRGIQVGESFDNMVDWPQRSVDDGFNPPAISSEIVRIPIEATWNTGARGCIRQTLPLPVTVLGITREYVGGGE